jgi:uncharacterized membrane protein YsdA (DUF1294 family)
MSTFSIYLLIVNGISGFLFVSDKIAAIKGKRRISERMQHFLELSGGVFINLILIYLLRHKNKKISYFAITYLIFAIWIAMFILHIKH